jgi:hypothetical protein
MMRAALLLAGVTVTAVQMGVAQAAHVTLPKFVEAGRAFSIPSSGSGKATFYIIGVGQVLKRDVVLGEPVFFAPGALFNAGHYVALLTGDSGTESGAFDVLPTANPANLTFLARPSRLPVSIQGGITGAAYVFDAYQNLIVVPVQISFELTTPSGAVQKRNMTTREGAAWVQMDSTPQQGKDKFVARVADVVSERVIGQVPGDPCTLKMSAHQAGQQIELQTELVKDCSGNAVPDGTIVTFTENYDGGQSTVDVPLKRGIAEVKMPAHAGARISVASGVVLGNEIRWER